MSIKQRENIRLATCAVDITGGCVCAWKQVLNRGPFIKTFHIVLLLLLHTLTLIILLIAYES